MSPFKNLILNTHGARVMYQLGVPDSGRSEVVISTDKDIGQDGIEHIFNVSKNWWEWSFSKYKQCVGVFSSSCFSSGLQSNVTRPVMGNCVMRDSHKLLPNIDNVFY